MIIQIGYGPVLSVLSQGKAKPPTMTINSYATKKA